MFIRRSLLLSIVLLCLVGLAAPVAAQTPTQTPTRVGQTFSFAGKRKEFKADNWTSAVVVSTYNSEGHISVLDETWKPGYRMAPKYHKSHAETFYVVSGSVEWTVGGETQTLGANDCVHVPAHTPFSARVVGTQEAKLVRMSQPGGFEVTQEYLQTLTPAQRADPKIAQLLALATDVYDATPAMLTSTAKVPTKYFDLRATRQAHEDDGASDVAVSSIQSGGRFNLQEELWEQNFFVGLHYHNTKTETFYVLGGKVEWTVGGETHVLTAGDAVHIPANTPHTARALDGTRIHTLLMYQPFGYDTRLGFRDALTPEQRRDPVVQEMLKTIQDFNPVRR